MCANYGNGYADCGCPDCDENELIPDEVVVCNREGEELNEKTNECVPIGELDLEDIIEDVLGECLEDS